jgi:hypothetical protein
MVYGRVVSVDIGVGLLSGVGVPNYRRLSRSRISQASSDGNEVNEEGKSRSRVDDDDDDDFGALGPSVDRTASYSDTPKRILFLGSRGEGGCGDNGRWDDGYHRPNTPHTPLSTRTLAQAPYTLRRMRRYNRLLL